MKRLTLLRHAKTEAEAASGRDFDRALTERGRSDARAIAGAIRSSGASFDRVLSSPAVRAMQTAAEAGLNATVDARIYNAPADQLLGIVRETVDSVTSLIMIGHNPGMEQLATILTGAPCEMSTATLIEMELAGEHWPNVYGGGARLIRQILPNR